ncbi:MAG: hypothetical protein R3C11_19100 [Planctomycetaceae bacterium]
MTPAPLTDLDPALLKSAEASIVIGTGKTTDMLVEKLAKREHGLSVGRSHGSAATWLAQ